MNELTIKIENPELTRAVANLTESISRLAAALLDEKALAAIFAAHMKKNQSNAPAAPVPPAASESAPANSPQPQAPTAPTAPTSPASAAPVPTSSAPAPIATIPLAGAPTYTLDQLAKAGASLVDAGKMEPLLALLGKYGLQAITQLQPAQYGAFATELRALGAQI